MRALTLASILLVSSAAWAQHTSPDAGMKAFETVRTVLQHPRCQNCHIPGDAPLQFDQGKQHMLGILRGAEGNGSPGLPCATCHGSQNPPESYGPHAPPGAPSWKLPPPDKKMVFIGLSSGDLCRQLKDTKANGGRDLKALTDHVDHDKLVLWGWSPGAGRQAVSIPHDQFMEAWNTWLAAAAPCAGDDKAH